MFGLIVEFFTSHSRTTWYGSEVIASLTAFSHDGLILARKFKADSIYYKDEILEIVDEGRIIAENLNQKFCDNFDYISDLFRGSTTARWYTREILETILKFETYTKSGADIVYAFFAAKKPGDLFYKYEIVDEICKLRDEFRKNPSQGPIVQYPENAPIVIRRYPYIGKHNTYNLYVLFSEEDTGTVLSAEFAAADDDVAKKYVVGYHTDDFVEWLFKEYTGWINLSITDQHTITRISPVSTYETDGRWDFH